MSDFLQISSAADALLGNVSPARRRAAAKAIAIAIRRSQAERIKAQQNPDGTPFIPRKRQELRGKKGRIKRQGQRLGPMFRKLGQISAMTADASPDGAEVAFRGAGSNRIARVHQLGLRDHVSRNPNSPEVRYPIRVLLGLSTGDLALVEATAFEALAR